MARFILFLHDNPDNPVGYGDFSPHTDAGKLFTIFYILIGIGIIATFANLLLKNTVAKRRIKRSKS